MNSFSTDTTDDADLALYDAIFLYKEVDKVVALPGDVLTYTLYYKNKDKYLPSTAETILVDTLPDNTSLIDNKVTLYCNNTIKEFTSNSNPIELDLGPIDSTLLCTISYKLKINPNIPLDTILASSFYLNAHYIDPYPDTDTPSYNVSNTSNIVYTNVSNNILTASLFADKSIIKLNDTLTYIIKIKNAGLVSASNIEFKNLIPTGTSFIKNSIAINCSSVSTDIDNSSLFINSIKPNELLIITFKVKVISMPTSEILSNSFNISYSYLSKTALGNVFIPNLSSNTVETKVVRTFIF